MLYVVTMSLRLGMTTSFSAGATSTSSLGSEVEEAPRVESKNWPENRYNQDLIIMHTLCSDVPQICRIY